MTEMVNKKCYLKYVDNKERTDNQNYVAKIEKLSWHEDMKKMTDGSFHK